MMWDYKLDVYFYKYTMNLISKYYKSLYGYKLQLNDLYDTIFACLKILINTTKAQFRLRKYYNQLVISMLKLDGGGAVEFQRYVAFDV